MTSLLYKEIQPFVAEDKQDIVTPLPSEPVPEEIDSDGENEETVPVTPKRAKKIPEHKIKGVDADKVLPIPHLNNDAN